MTYFSKIFAVRTEFQNLRRRRAVCRPRHIAAIEHEDVSFRIHGNAGCFAKMQIGRKLEKIGDGVEGNFRYGLRKESGRHHQKQSNNEDKGFHVASSTTMKD